MDVDFSGGLIYSTVVYKISQISPMSDDAISETYPFIYNFVIQICRVSLIQPIPVLNSHKKRCMVSILEHIITFIHIF